MTTTKAMPLSGGMRLKKLRSASMAPAEPPSPTTDKADGLCGAMTASRLSSEGEVSSFSWVDGESTCIAGGVCDSGEDG